MYLSFLSVANFRNFSELAIEPHRFLNIIYGQNGAGKSSVLEALHLLGYGRSFRTSKANSMLKHDENELLVFASLIDETKGAIKKIGCSRSKKNGYTYKVNGDLVPRLSDLVKHIPVQIFTPQTSDLLLGGPSERRKFLDWILFHVEHDFVSCFSSFSKVLHHRNALLRKSKQNSTNFNRNDLVYWNEQFSNYGELLTEYRMRYCEELNTETCSILKDFLPEFDLRISYNSGWDSEKSLTESLVDKMERDLIYGYSTIGPQKGDLVIKVNGMLASEILSRGQLRLLVSVMQLAHMRSFTKHRSQSLIYLIDDIAAELDIAARKKFMQILVDSKAQVFVTAIEKQQFDFMNDYNDKKVFHVEHDQVNEE